MTPPRSVQNGSPRQKTERLAFGILGQPTPTRDGESKGRRALQTKELHGRDRIVSRRAREIDELHPSRATGDDLG
jgi:hypothetical protein